MLRGSMAKLAPIEKAISWSRCRPNVCQGETKTGSRMQIDACLGADRMNDRTGCVLDLPLPLKMHDHEKFLADQLLSEKRPVTYRILSRALDVHVNTAKCMLYEFYQAQNALKANSVYATFAIYGRKSTEKKHQNGHDVMSSSIPESEPRAEVIPGQTLTLVGEEKLEAVARFADVATSILKAVEEEPLSGATKYGTISNTMTPRCDSRNRSGTPAVCSSNHDAKLPGKLQDKGKEAPKLKKAAETPAQATLTRGLEREPASASRRGFPHGNMLPFTKSASGPSTKPSRAIQEGEDDTPALSDDGEADDSDVLPSKLASSALHKNAAIDKKKERENKLKRLMNSDDELDVEKDEASQPEPEPESEPEPKTETVTNLQTGAEAADVLPSSANGRRRGKRLVMKKKRILDDQGYMVTIQNAEWESFSEDDTTQASAEKATSTSTPSSSETTARKTSGKTNQGKIMSFFFKKGGEPH